jgi:homoisocitrate dehydrogenase
MSGDLVLLRGDGVGEELIDQARLVLDTLCPDLSYAEHRIGYGAFSDTGAALPTDTLEALRAARASLLVAVGSPLHPVPGYRSPVVQVRRELDLFANLRPVRGPEGSDVDLLIVRENTEGLYVGRERRSGDRAWALRQITRTATERIARVAGEAARERTGLVCVVHKANVLRESCGLFREVCLETLAEFGDLEIEELLVDNAAYQLAARPERFDVLVTSNLFGDILSDVAAHAGGGLGVVHSVNRGPQHTLCEPVHGSAPDIAGQGLANPTATLRALGEALAALGRAAASHRLRQALAHVERDGPRTPDAGGRTGTRDVVTAILARVSLQGAVAAGPGLVSRE